MSLQSFLTVGGTLLSSSQYREGAWAYNAAGVACVIRAVVTMPLDLPKNGKVLLHNYIRN